ncbi:hypothetical protein SERLA73DRAFT_175364 [Serpula lacrymans var. lacrymans S7.3]|uniref:Uncharacterized protein n=2 Tax=Serpula lacrymans var. lacrymans TaxID=341189 RepID=F8PJB8_SERL3|nr:uncharacterized protein SERLADRAFT_445392 [Serpula lacrymans var. lacrymans S7.9]EGO03743.1 hypothetical protein SERLA73DRAFT_175364 [Serpula lacrymans var. lacrymans S7.3]EGO29610.1 hypothetical protein SERLADRAFT_445392 [Serpula lacrymans var. lacrymans S7.9]
MIFRLLRPVGTRILTFPKVRDINPDSSSISKYLSFSQRLSVLCYEVNHGINSLMRSCCAGTIPVVSAAASVIHSSAFGANLGSDH